jgi:hypothetical protein
MYLPATHRSLANDASGDLTLTSAANEIAAQATGGVLHAPEFYAAIQDGKIASSIPDDRLRLIFTCCHPALGQMAQVALTLRRFAACRRPTSPGPFSSERRHRMIAHYMSDVNHLLSRERESATTRTANTRPHSRSASYHSPTIVCPRALTGSPVVDSVSRHKPCHGRAAAPIDPRAAGHATMPRPGSARPPAARRSGP